MTITATSPAATRLLEVAVSGGRLSADDALILMSQASLADLSAAAVSVKRMLSGDDIYYNRNFHIEPTNICRYNCRFCSYRRSLSEPGGWTMSLRQIEEQVERYADSGITEVHLVGGVHPSATLDDYLEIVRTVRRLMPEAAIKAFSAIEHIYVFDKAGVSFDEGLRRFMEAGMDTLTGGGAEIFAPEVRGRICPDKPSGERWLALHEAAHGLGIKTNATMLYGHIESHADRIDHLLALRRLQDRTGGFNAFIPLKYRCAGNSMSHIGECPVSEDLRTLAVSRLFLDNVPHIKAYWPMYGAQATQTAMRYGADDIDGTVADTTRIYSMAGVEPPALTLDGLRSMIEEEGFRPVERDTFYNAI
ncbi:MAG: CofH family radical SAM protein [Rikenellaceae bacterium]|nr:CofH family radical SAM protein [Rikenellaceae bacterium]